jgi:hypothetical protein
VCSTAAVEEGGLPRDGGSWVQSGKLDPEILREIDITKETEFAIGASLETRKVLSTHPADSYELTAVDELSSNLKILDAARFWSGEKYLVVMFND